VLFLKPLLAFTVRQLQPGRLRLALLKLGYGLDLFN
jgi:hypothetical protein